MIKKLFIKSLTVKNFRSIKNFDSHNNFGQINLISGKNNSGKTTLLESLFLNLGPTNPLLWFNINARRGLKLVSPEQNTASYLFYQLNTSIPIIFNVETTNYPPSELKIKYLGPISYKISQPHNEFETNSHSEKNNKTDVEKSVSIEFDYKTTVDNKIRKTKAIIHSDKITSEGSLKNIYPDSVFISVGTSFNLEEEAKRYDYINKVNEIPIYEELLKKTVIPGLKRTSLGIENGIAMIHGDEGYGLVPLVIFGSGGRRLNSILLALASHKDGIVLIDEIENSFHHSILEKIWTVIAELAENNGSQIFATTHSVECIESALKVFEKRKNIDFKLHRLDRKNENTDIFTFDIEQLESALKTGWDIR